MPPTELGEEGKYHWTSPHRNNDYSQDFLQHSVSRNTYADVVHAAEHWAARVRA